MRSGREPPSLSLFKEEDQQIRKGERRDRKTLCLPPYSIQVANQCGQEPDGTRRDRRDAVQLMRRRLTKRAWPTTTHRARGPGRTRTSDSPFPQAGPWDDPTMKSPSRGSPAGLTGRSDGPGNTTEKRPLKDKYLCLLTLSNNFFTEPPTPATAWARTLLGGCWGRLFV